VGPRAAHSRLAWALRVPRVICQRVNGRFELLLATTALSWAALTAAVRPAWAADAPPATPDPARDDPAARALQRLADSVHRTTLANGLRVVLNRDPGAPTVAVSVTYDVGSRNEAPGQSGFAHLFEHLMFQGSRHVPRGQHFALITERGGSLNGTTDEDRTVYYETLPSSELPLALYLEADRMRWLDVSEQNFENQRAVVEEEYRMRVANAPYAVGLLRLPALVFANYPPYAHPTIGSLQDLDAARLDWVQQFYLHHYGPNTAVLTIAGDFDENAALGLIHRYFGAAERRETTPFAAPTANAASGGQAAPEARRESREVVTDRNVNTPGIAMGYRIPPYRSSDHYALELAALLLGGGEASRLFQDLVRDQALVQNISVATDDHRGPDALVLFAVLNERASLAQVERDMLSAVARLGQEAPSRVELGRAKSQLEHDYAFGLQSNLRRAIRLGEYELFYGDARLLAGELSQYLAVTPEDVRRAVAEYLIPERRSTVEIRPAGAEAGR
jgi:zinc protease